MPSVYYKRQTDWVENRDEERYETDTNYRLRVRYFETMRRAWPDWSDDAEAYRRIYKECDRRRAKGEDVNVDHVVPLRGTLVCGLHVPWNLEIVHRLKNLDKTNKWWPDAPFERIEMELDTCQILQKELPLS